MKTKNKGRNEPSSTSSISMKKKDKKRKKISHEPISSLCNIVGISSDYEEATGTRSNLNNSLFAVNTATTGSRGGSRVNNHVTANNDLDDLESCLALMDQTIMNQQTTTNVTTTTDDDDQCLKDTTTSSSSQSQENTNHNHLWKGLFGSDVKSSSLKNQHLENEFYLPNIQIELARHKHMGELSQLLLSKCPKLRMPSFERWLIDSKLEERKKRNDIERTNIQLQMEEESNNGHLNFQQKKEMKWKQRMKRKRNELKSSLDRHLTSSGMRTLNEYDDVIPTMADIDDGATQRLIKEIQVSNGEDVENDNGMSTSALTICRELCQQACTAGRHIQNLNHHLGGPIHVNHYFNDKKSLSSNAVVKIMLKMDNASSNNSNDESSRMYSLIYSRKSKKGSDMKPFVLNINSQHYEKLRHMFNAIHKSNEKLLVKSHTNGRGEIIYSPATKIFHHLVFCILLRYASLAGGQQLFDLRGGGMQVRLLLYLHK